MKEQLGSKTTKVINRRITRRQAVKAGGIMAAGLVFSKPVIETLRPASVYAQVSPIGTPTPKPIPPFPNGSFETGDFTDWKIVTTPGPTSAMVIGSLGSITPTDGSFMAKIDTGVASGTVTRIKTKNFLVPSGVTFLVIDYNFLTDEPTPSPTSNDFLLAVLSTPSGDVRVPLADTRSSFIPAPGTGFSEQTGFLTHMFDVSSHAGLSIPCSLDLQVGVSDAGNSNVTSAALIDNVHFV